MFLLLIASFCVVLSHQFESKTEFPREKCEKPNEEFHMCKSLCPETCFNINDTSLCIPGCAVGCTCKPGYVRNSENNCVAIADCFKESNGATTKNSTSGSQTDDENEDMWNSRKNINTTTWDATVQKLMQQPL